MRRCWAQDTADRPRASELVFALEEMMGVLRKRRTGNVSSSGGGVAAAVAAAGGDG